MTRPVVVLVGPPGAGKSTVGRVLAERLGVALRDTDADIEAATGQSIADIFLEHGEEHFRALEREHAAAAISGHAGVLALGGGSVLDPGTRERLAGAPVAFLDVGITDAARRIGLNRERPLLLGNPRAQWIELMEARRPVYESVATATVHTDGRTPAQVAEEIEKELGM